MNKPAGWDISAWRCPPHSLFDLTGRVALVTGAASGLGRAIALGLDAYGAHVVLTDCNATGLDEVATALTNSCLAVRADITSAEQVDGMIQSALNGFGRIDVGFVVPGINVRKPAVELTDDDWARVVDLNLTAMFRCGREMGRVMLKQGSGSITFMASARGLTGGSNQSVYSASKAAIIGLVRCLAWEWAPCVRVNALAPGYMATPLVAQIASNPAWWQSTQALHALRRVGAPEEIVGPAIFLASEASSFVTGSVLTVDGGWTAGAP